MIPSRARDSSDQCVDRRSEFLLHPLHHLLNSFLVPMWVESALGYIVVFEEVHEHEWPLAEDFSVSVPEHRYGLHGVDTRVLGLHECFEL